MGLGLTGNLWSNYLRSALDVLVLAFIFYKVYEVLVKTQAAQLVKGAMILVALYGIAFVLKLSTVTWILGILAPGVVIAVAIVFQPELRKLVTKLGQGSLIRGSNRPRVGQIEVVLNAAEQLSAVRRGALIVFARNVGIKDFIDTGTRLDSLVSSNLIKTIFQYDTALHDGALIIQDGRIAAAGCFLKLSEQRDISNSFGTRHRAALGLSETTDAVILVVSEETGALSLAYDSKLYYGLTSEQVRRKLNELLEFHDADDVEEKHEQQK